MNTHRIISVLVAAGLSAPAAAQDHGHAAGGFDFGALAASLQQSDLTPGYVLIEGDIQVPLAQYMAVLAGTPPEAIFGDATFWPGGVVPYDFVTSGGGAVSAANQAAAVAAMNTIRTHADVGFRPATGADPNRIRFQNSGFNNSPVGVQGGVQIINITSWGNQIVICHELYHALGFWHEQSRPDRNTFITVNTANICGSGSSSACIASQCCLCNACGSCLSNFSIHTGTLIYGAYDFDSFMHYGPFDFSCNGMATITVNPPYTATIGQRDHFSYYDSVSCRGVYPFPSDRWWKPGHPGTGAGTLPNPLTQSTFGAAYSATPAGGTLFIRDSGGYAAVGTYSKAMTIKSPLGATLGN
ncbi:MAG: M12 family metallopeptidase [Phycisphaerales bacterium]